MEFPQPQKTEVAKQRQIDADGSEADTYMERFWRHEEDLNQRRDQVGPWGGFRTNQQEQGMMEDLLRSRPKGGE